jgi:tetratricopeptide (TPR) repeat protein
MYNVFLEHRRQILVSSYSTELLQIYPRQNAIAEAQNTLWKLQVSKAEDAELLAKTAWQIFIHDGITQYFLRPLGQDLAALHMQLGRTNEALAVLEKMWQTRSLHSVPLELLPVGQDLAALYMQLGRMDEALAVLEKMWQPRSPKHGVPFELLPVGQDLAALYMQLGRTDEALAVLKNC